MNAFKKNTLHTAVLAGLVAVTASAPAEAVHINRDGLGQVLIFPYYTARAGQFTAIQIANTQNNTKAVKVRFLEGKNGREVLDFNLFMSPNDAWTGAVIATTNGAKVISNDNSCVAPSDLFTETRKDALQVQLVNEFKHYEYTGNSATGTVDNPTMNSLDRTREGYFEVIEMGVIDDDLITGNTMNAFNNTQFVTAFIKHNSAGIPANCPAVDSYDPNSSSAIGIRFPNVGANGTLMQPPRGGLAGRASIINAATGANYTFMPTAIGGWSATIQYSASGSTSPALSAANPPVSNVIVDNGVVSATWTTGRDAMSAVLMRNSVQNEFILDAGTQSQTDWIVTFPTKRYHDKVGAGVADVASRPFANNFHNTVNDGSCDPYGSAAFNREEQAIPPPTGFPFPGELPAPIPGLCWGANIIPFGATSLLSSTNINPLGGAAQIFVNGATSFPASSTTPSIRGTQGPNGWLMMNFDSATQVLAPVSAVLIVDGVPAPVPTAFGRHSGLPVIGAMLHNYLNTGVASRYGGVLEHRFTRNIN